LDFKVATFEKVREISTGKKIRVKKSTGKKVRKKQIWGKNKGKKIPKKIRKKIRENSTGEKYTGKKYGKKIWEKSTGVGSMGKNSKAGQDIFWSRDFVTSGVKGPTRADSAQLPVEHAQNTLPNMASSGHVTSGHFRIRHFGRFRLLLLKYDLNCAHILLLSYYLLC
jgi:hypothetical protein